MSTLAKIPSRRQIIRLVASGSLCFAPAVGWAGTSSSASDLGLGLQGLKWDMSQRDAKRHFPLLDGPAPEIGLLDNQLVQNPYVYKGCNFVLTLHFAGTSLNEADLKSDSPAHYKSCTKKVKAALSEQYRSDTGGFSTSRNPNGYTEYAAWSNEVTAVVYDDLENALMEISFSAISRK